MSPLSLGLIIVGAFFVLVIVSHFFEKPLERKAMNSDTQGIMRNVVTQATTLGRYAESMSNETPLLKLDAANSGLAKLDTLRQFLSDEDLSRLMDNQSITQLRLALENQRELAFRNLQHQCPDTEPNTFLGMVSGA